MNVWVCQVRREAFVGGESQRCRHVYTSPTSSGGLQGCGVMELIGGEPVEWCVTHLAEWTGQGEFHYCWRYEWLAPDDDEDPCQFVPQVRVGP